MLKQRILTALVLVPLAIASILFLPTPWFSWVLLGIMLIGAWEWAGLTGVQQPPYRLLFAASLGLLLIGLRLYGMQGAHTVIMIGVAWWVMAVILLPYYQRTDLPEHRWQLPLRLVMFLVLGSAWTAYTLLHQLNPEYVLYLVMLSIMADTAAYFSGKAFGKNKLAPELSPGKTREGLLGGLVGVALLALLAGWYFGQSVMAIVYFVLLSLVTALVSVVGDLFISMIKRESGAKDSGWILPGHGGILDRIDSHIATAPVFTLGLLWWQGLLS